MRPRLAKRDRLRRLILSSFSPLDLGDYLPQALLVRLARESFLGSRRRWGGNYRTIRDELETMAAEGLLHVRIEGRYRTYRLGSRFQHPGRIGFTRDDCGLTNPVPHVTPDGRFFLVGEPTPRAAWVRPISTSQSHPDAFLWFRACLHAASQGLFFRPDQDRRTALRIVTGAARHGAVTLARLVYESGAAPQRFAKTYETGPWTQAPASVPGDHWPPKPVDDGAAAAALTLLHDTYDHKPRAFRAALARPLPSSRGSDVFNCLDAAIAAHVAANDHRPENHCRIVARWLLGTLFGWPDSCTESELARSVAAAVRPQFREMDAVTRRLSPAGRAMLVESFRAAASPAAGS